MLTAGFIDSVVDRWLLGCSQPHVVHTRLSMPDASCLSDSPGPLMNTNPGGSTSVNVALSAVTEPKLMTEMVYVTSTPRGTVALRDFVMVTSGPVETAHAIRKG
jgi:hypothetical protein